MLLLRKRREYREDIDMIDVKSIKPCVCSMKNDHVKSYGFSTMVFIN